MGGTVVRTVAALTSFGGSELARDKPFQSGGGSTNPLMMLPLVGWGYAGAKAAGAKSGKTDFTGAGEIKIPKPTLPIAAVAPPQLQTDEERERLARIEGQRRRKEFKNLGRSGTLLTGPGGLTGSGPGEAKSLLGY